MEEREGKKRGKDKVREGGRGENVRKKFTTCKFSGLQVKV